MTRSGVWPDHSIVERFACIRVPADGCFSLVGNANSFDLLNSVAIVFEVGKCLVDTLLDRRDQLKRIMLVPSAK